MQRITVLFPAPVECYDYLSETELSVGQIVRASFGRKEQIGVVWDRKTDLTIPDEKVKGISEVLPLPVLPMETIQFVNWVAGYTLSPTGMVLKTVLAADFEKESRKKTEFEEPNSWEQMSFFRIFNKKRLIV